MPMGFVLGVVVGQEPVHPVAEAGLLLILTDGWFEMRKMTDDWPATRSGQYTLVVQLNTRRGVVAVEGSESGSVESRARNGAFCGE